MLKQPLEKIMTKPMDRRGFLKHVGIGIIGVLGLLTILKSFSEVDSQTNQNIKSRRGYGFSDYGE